MSSTRRSVTTHCRAAALTRAYLHARQSAAVATEDVVWWWCGVLVCVCLTRLRCGGARTTTAARQALATREASDELQLPDKLDYWEFDREAAERDAADAAERKIKVAGTQHYVTLLRTCLLRTRSAGDATSLSYGTPPNQQLWGGGVRSHQGGHARKSNRERPSMTRTKKYECVRACRGGEG